MKCFYGRIDFTFRVKITERKAHRAAREGLQRFMCRRRAVQPDTGEDAVFRFQTNGEFRVVHRC